MAKLPLPPLGYTPTCHIEDATRDREYWATRRELDEETRRRVCDADIVIVPEGDDYQGKGIYFPEGTTELYHFLLSQNVSVEVAAEDADFKELARHFDLYILGEFVLKDVALPIFIGLLLKHLENRFLNREKSAIKIGLTCQKADGSAKHLSYEGPVNVFESEVRTLLQDFWGELSQPDSPPSLPPPNDDPNQPGGEN
jgi:hypothetical protein